MVPSMWHYCGYHIDIGNTATVVDVVASDFSQAVNALPVQGVTLVRSMMSKVGKCEYSMTHCLGMPSLSFGASEGQTFCKEDTLAMCQHTV